MSKITVRRASSNIKEIRYDTIDKLFDAMIFIAEWGPMIQRGDKFGIIYKNDDFHFCKMNDEIAYDAMLYANRSLWDHRNEPKEIIREKYKKMYNDYIVISEIIN